MWFSRAKAVAPDALPVRQREDLPALLARLDWTVLRRLDGLLQDRKSTRLNSSHT